MIVTSAAVPAVVGIAIIGIDLFFVFATPSSDTTSENSGLFIIMPIAFAVSIAEPPPIAKMKSALLSLNARIPSLTLEIVGLGYTSSKISKRIEFLIKISVTLLTT